MLKIESLGYLRESHPIFEGLSLEVEKGSVTAIFGPSGTGKTTLLQLISGCLVPDAGAVYFDGCKVAQLSRPALYALRKRMGFLVQTGALFTEYNVYENVALPLRVHTSLPEEIIRSVCAMKLEAVGMRGAENFMPRALSGGMTKRVALARALVLDPELLLLDEPFAGQDPTSSSVVAKLITDLNQAIKMTVVLVSHDIPETLRVADYAYLIMDGHVVAQGPKETFLDQDNAHLKAFISGAVRVQSVAPVLERPYERDLFNDLPQFLSRSSQIARSSGPTLGEPHS